MALRIDFVFAVCLAVIGQETLFAHSPGDFLEVMRVQPGRMIEHDLELQSVLDESRSTSDVRGPAYFSRAVGAMGMPVAKNRANLNWFTIQKPKKEMRRTIEVLDIVRGGERKSVTIQSAEYLLSPSQLITTGAPDPVPHGLDLYKAYRVIEADLVDDELDLKDATGPAERKLGKLLYVCLATSQWHHEDTVQVTHPENCFAVYQLDAQSVKAKFTTIDQFGLNELTAIESRWLCVRAVLLPSSDGE